MKMTWSEYVADLGQNQAQIARSSGVSQATVSRWVSGDVIPDAEKVVGVARAFEESPLVALVAAGYLEANEINAAVQMPRRYLLRSFTELELAQEMLRRVADGTGELLERPMDVDHPAWSGVGGASQDDVEALPHAAKGDAQEVEEDDHTP
jgi:transcriptional regulator with XRE-family HTH domain